ncbi:MAG: RdgB/HAM1 family non-canonical purine NTP pyrophosphatase [Actinobacteria bacterium]|nr:RdgB/HAM1 family non-canonical purine NTP pyrophosphatase [Actinomycetota bacterium]
MAAAATGSNGKGSKVVLASRNQHKIAEVRRILADARSDIELVGLDELAVAVQEVPETGATFAENALIKAQSVVDATGLPAIADDSGIEVDALNGMPGVLSARWAGKHGDDMANLDLVLAQISDVPEQRRGASFVAAVVLVRDGASPIVVEGKVSGRLLFHSAGEGGFGYDPIFVPAGQDLTTAEMSAEQKDQVSHRGQALRALVTRMKEDEHRPS